MSAAGEQLEGSAEEAGQALEHEMVMRQPRGFVIHSFLFILRDPNRHYQQQRQRKG